jgi:hypothetical protein
VNEATFVEFRTVQRRDPDGSHCRRLSVTTLEWPAQRAGWIIGRLFGGQACARGRFVQGTHAW